MRWRDAPSNIIWAIVFVFLFGASALAVQFMGAWAETHISFLEHSGPRRIVYIKRTSESVCWTQEFDKYKAGRIESLNYHLSDDLGNIEAFTPMRARNTEGDLPSPNGLNTGEPPKLSEETPVGTNIRTSWCGTLPSWAKPNSTITIYGSIGYAGPKLFGFPLWSYAIEAPQISFYPNTP